MPLIPCLNAEVMHFFIARRKATRFSSCEATFSEMMNRVRLRFLDFDDIQKNFVLRKTLNGSLELFDASALLADHDPRTRPYER